MSKQYRSIGLGGAFDHFHAGHQAFLTMVASLTDKAYIGISTVELIREKELAYLIQPWAEREAAVRNFLEPFGIEVETFELVDPFGPTLEPGIVEAVAVTEQTQRGGELINEQRVMNGLSPLPIHVCEMVRDETGEIISSTRIRAGEIDRHGNVYIKYLQDIILNEEQRQFFGKPQGEIIDVKNVKQMMAREISSEYPQILLVGDVCTESFFEHNIPFSLGIIDGLSRRELFQTQFADRMKLVKSVKNVAGGISSELAATLQAELQSKNPSKENYRIIKIEGEEDLATVAAVLLAPLNTHVFYGQPNQGLVHVLVTEEKKQEFLQPFLRR